MNAADDVLLYGAGGHARSIRAVLRHLPGMRPVAVLDDAPSGGDFMDLPLLPADRLLAGALDCRRVILAIGDNRARRDVHDRLRAARPDLEFPAVVAASAIVDPTAQLGAGTVVFERAIVNACADVGAGCIVNTASVVEHDCRLGDFASVAPGAVMAGRAALGALAALGANGTIIDKVTVGDAATIGAGGVAVADLPGGETYVGIPARPLSGRTR